MAFSSCCRVAWVSSYLTTMVAWPKSADASETPFTDRTAISALHRGGAPPLPRAALPRGGAVLAAGGRRRADRRAGRGGPAQSVAVGARVGGLRGRAVGRAPAAATGSARIHHSGRRPALARARGRRPWAPRRAPAGGGDAP